MCCSRREKKQLEEQQEADGSKEKNFITSRRRRAAAAAPKKTFELGDVYAAAEQAHADFDFSEEIPVDSPPMSHLAYLAQTVMSGIDGFAKKAQG